jgi:hypothetical protein
LCKLGRCLVRSHGTATARRTGALSVDSGLEGFGAASREQAGEVEKIVAVVTGHDAGPAAEWHNVHAALYVLGADAFQAQRGVRGVGSSEPAKAGLRVCCGSGGGGLKIIDDEGYFITGGDDGDDDLDDTAVVEYDAVSRSEHVSVPVMVDGSYRAARQGTIRSHV